MSQSITNSEHVYQLLSPLVSNDCEEFWVIALTSNKKLIQAHRVFKGTVDHCLFHPRDIFRFVILMNASSFIVAHNHPSEDTTPSEQDIKITKRLKNLSLLFEIPLVDHIILTQKNYSSFLDLGLINP